MYFYVDPDPTFGVFVAAGFIDVNCVLQMGTCRWFLNKKVLTFTVRPFKKKHCQRTNRRQKSQTLIVSVYELNKETYKVLQ